MVTEKLVIQLNKNIRPRSGEEFMDKVYVIIVNFNTWKDTIECVQSILTTENAFYSIIIVDNDSNDTSVERIQSWINLKKTKIDIKLIKSEYNRGFSGGNNLGINYALKQKDMDYIWLLNSDTIVKSDTLMNLLKLFLSNKKNYGIVGSVLCDYYNRNRIQALGGNFRGINKLMLRSMRVLQERKITELERNDYSINFPVGASLMLSKKFLIKIGYKLSEDYFLYYEEADLTMKCIQYGFNVGYSKDSIVYHKGGCSTGENKINNSNITLYHMARSRIIFCRKYRIKYIFFVLIGLLLSIIKRMIKQDGKISPILKGIVHGLKYKLQ